MICITRNTYKGNTMIDHAANLALFLTERTGSCLGQWKGRMSAKQQRELFGTFLGKGVLIIDGSTETIQHVVKTCFGLDYDVTKAVTFSGLTFPNTSNLLAALGPCGK